MPSLFSEEPLARQRLEELCTQCPLPGGYSLAETFFERARVAKLELWMTGLVAKGAADDIVTGSAAQAEGFPVDRAYFELIERASLLLARKQQRLNERAYDYERLGTLDVAQVFPPDADPSVRRRSLSNGVALHRSWQAACDAALNELLERDAVLSSFFGQHAPQRVDAAGGTAATALREQYTEEVFTFGVTTSSVTTGVFLFPREAHVDPLAFGFAAARDLDESRAAAEREALQRLAFLTGEPLPTADPEPSAVPEYHQDYYLYPQHHARLRRWLTGAFTRDGSSRSPIERDRVTFVDLTPPSLQGRVFVAKAQSALATQLEFGPPKPDEPPYPHPIA